MRAGAGGAVLNYLISLNILQSILILQIQERAPGLTALNVKMLFGVFRYASGNTARSLMGYRLAGYLPTSDQNCDDVQSLQHTVLSPLSGASKARFPYLLRSLTMSGYPPYTGRRPDLCLVCSM